MRLMADTTDHAAPAGYDLYAGYTDGAYRSFPYLNAQYPGRTISITVVGDPTAEIEDVESGDVTPAHAPHFVQAKGATRFCVWVAAYGVAHCPFPGAVAWQKIDHGPHGENIDISEVYVDDWPRPDIPTIYCPYSSLPAVLDACRGAGLTLVTPQTWPTPAPSPDPAPVSQEEDEMVRLFIHTDAQGNSGEFIGVFGHWCRPIPTSGLWDFYVRNGVPVHGDGDNPHVLDDVFSQMTKLPVSEG